MKLFKLKSSLSKHGFHPSNKNSKFRLKNTSSHLANVLLLLSAFTLTACGGSGSSTATTITDTTRACPKVSGTVDPLYSDQWHLKNTGSPTGTANEDVNIESVWSTYCGLDIIIAIVDDGLEIAHEDLAANILAGGSHNYVNNSNDPTPPAGSTDAHGTSCAGVAGAVGFNGIGVRGAAPGVQLVGYNLLQASNTVNEADSMIRGTTGGASNTRSASSSSIDISSNSHGAPDDGQAHESVITWRAAIDDGITNGRGGKGINYFWAGGNGRSVGDNSNYDGQANYHGVNAVAALNDTGKQASYSESGANVLISAHAGEFCSTNTITTVDLSGTDGANNAGDNNGQTDYASDSYTQCFNGTSSATPLVSGIAALILDANPNLSRRDMRLLLARTARKNDPADAGWEVNAAATPMNINHKYGFGAIDAQAAVTAATSWTLLTAEKTPETYNSGTLSISIPDSPGSPTYGTAETNTINVATSAISQLEFVEVTFASDHTYWTDLKIVLTSPGGTQSILSEAHNTKDNIAPSTTALVSGFRFGSVRHTDETATGNWIISVQDGANLDTGNITSWSIKLYGR